MINRFLTAFVCKKDPQRKEVVIVVPPMLGIGLHSLLRRLYLFDRRHHQPLTGFLAPVGMVLHEFAEGVLTYLRMLVP